MSDYREGDKIISRSESITLGQAWGDMIDGLRDGKGNNRYVVHRPLLTLMLLGRAQRGETNWVRFNDIDASFWDAIRQFAPSRVPSGLEFPFWYLQKNGYWIIEHPERLPRVKHKDRPTRRGLIKHNPKGYVPLELWNELTSSPERIKRLAGRIIADFWPNVQAMTIATALDLQL